MRFIHLTLRRSRAKHILGTTATDPFAENLVPDTAGHGPSTETNSALQDPKTLRTSPTLESKDTNTTTLVASDASGQATKDDNGHTTVLGKRDLPLTQNAWKFAVDQYINQLKPRDQIAVLQWKNIQGLSIEDVENILVPLKQSYMKEIVPPDKNSLSLPRPLEVLRRCG